VIAIKKEYCQYYNNKKNTIITRKQLKTLSDTTTVYIKYINVKSKETIPKRLESLRLK